MAALLEPFSHSAAALDFETSGLEPCDPTGYIRSFALAGESGVIAVDLLNSSEDACSVFWQWAVQHQHGFLFHNAGFDTSWALKHGHPTPLPLKACTLLLFRYLASEGWTGQDWSLKTAMTDVLLWDEPNTEDLYAWLKANKLDKGQMSKAPWEILSKYMAMDAEATWLLYQELITTMERRVVPANIQENFWDFYQNDALNELELLREQHIEGMHLDMDKLATFQAQQSAEAEAKHASFFEHELMAGPLKHLYDSALAKLESDKPEQFTKTGGIAKRYEAWEQKLATAKAYTGPDLLNVDSSKQLSWLFYQYLKYPVVKETPGGIPSVDAKVLHKLGPLGKLLKVYRKDRDLLKFADSLAAVQIDRRLHPNIRQAGAVTGRNSGGT